VKFEFEPISDDEWLLRRVRIERFRLEKTPFISPDAFAPRTKGRDLDDNGISLYRLACLDVPEKALATIPDDSKRSQTGLVKIPVSVLRQLGLTIVADPDERIPGHVLIPELNADGYRSRRHEVISIMTVLAELASANVVRLPLAAG
jgi:hypothetical protein